MQQNEIANLKQEREKTTFDDNWYYRRFWGTVAANFVGFESMFQVSVVAGSASGFSLVGMGLMAYPLTYIPWTLVGRGLQELLCYTHPAVRMASLFVFNASMTFLTIWIGLAIVTAFAATAFNPFTLPCLIGVAVAAAVFFAAALAVYSRTHYRESSVPSLSSEVMNVLNPLSKRTLDHHKNEMNGDGGLWVKPLDFTGFNFFNSNRPKGSANISPKDGNPNGRETSRYQINNQHHIIMHS